jgi:hypothetical protein
MDTQRSLVRLPDGRHLDVLVRGEGEGHLSIGVSSFGRLVDELVDGVA